jgi:hypothetical protein
LAACGGSSGGGGDPPSTLNPANMIPDTAIMYVSLTVRPQGSLKGDLTNAIDSLGGKGASTRVVAELDKSLGKTLGQMKGWVGERVGLAFMGFPTNPDQQQDIVDDMVIVAPTNDPSTAKSVLAQQFNQPDTTSSVVGNYAIFGGQDAVGLALATTSSTSLASMPSFRSAMARLGGDQLFTFYAPLRRFMQAIMPLAKAGNPSAAGELNAALAEIPAGSSEALGLTVLPNQLRLNVVTRRPPKSGPPPSGAPADVNSLPGDSWLALVLSGGLAKQSTLNSMTAMVPRLVAEIQAKSGSIGQKASAPLQFVEQDLLPALGPMSLSIAGTSTKSLRAGLVMRPLDQSAGGRLATAINKLVKGSPVAAGTVGNRVLVMFGYSNPQQLLAPASRLADNPTFRRALAQLPAGSKADIYVNFGPIALLSALDHSAGDAKVWNVVRRFKYLIAGGTHGDYRIVFAFRCGAGPGAGPTRRFLSPRCRSRRRRRSRVRSCSTR